MRLIFLLLVLAHLAFYAWVHYLRVVVDADARIQQVQITPEKIRLLNAPAPRVPGSAATTPRPDKAAAACLEWGAFIGPEAVRADAAIAELGLPAAQLKRVAVEQPGYWVLIPPLKTRVEAERTAERLKGLGITDIVLDPPQRRNAISLGIFRTEEAAQTLLGAVKKKGVDNAVLELRENFFRRVVFYVREPDAATTAQLNALRAATPGTDIKALICPAG